MGLLEALDFHKHPQRGVAGECVEVEYQLYSWGEIACPFQGDREHSTAARYILTNPPFKLFSSSTPSDPVPQELCLTFKAPDSVSQHEIAKEFAAFLSIVSRRRVFVSRQMRSNGLPIKQEVDLYPRAHFQHHQRPRVIKPKEIYQLLENLQTMDRRTANGFVLAMRLYHTAVEMMYTEPEFAYLFLVTCLESISSVAYKGYKPHNEEGFLDSRFPGWRTSLLVTLSPEQSTVLKEVLLKNETFTFRKLSKFVSENLPERFWTDIEDDAKPDCLISRIGLGPDGLGQECISRSDITIRDWEKIERGKLKQVLREIYNARSQLVHEGIRLPQSIVVGLFHELSDGAFASMTKNGQISPLLTFERLVSYSMVEFLRKQQSGSVDDP